MLSFLAIVAVPGTLGAQDTQPAKEVLFLSGTDKDHTVPWDFICSDGRRSGTWTTIEVPSCWEQQGFGSYDYGRNYHTYGKKYRFSDETGTYKHNFSVPSGWKNRRIYLVFEGVMTDAEVQVNGQPAGEPHQGAFYRFRYDVTGKIRPGASNDLEVKVSKMSADPSVNRAERYADYWIFGGIFRPVYLESFPVEHIERVAVSAGADGSFSADVFAKGLQGPREITVTVTDRLGRIAGESRISMAKGQEKAVLNLNVPAPDRWTAETPHLYKARFVLSAGQKTLFETEEKFGFRTIGIRHGDGVYLNGVKIKFKGVNRHCFWPESGRTLSREIDLMDVRLIKEMNMNAVRCSHYPPDAGFLDLCDSLGLYVLDELAGWQNAYDTEVGEKLVREMVIRDVNHPSVIFWSNGNEGGTNKELDDDFALYDPSDRPVIHAHHRPGNDFNGIETNHYENYYSTRNILNDSLIYIPTEFLHGQDDGGAAAGLSDFWELMWRHPRSGGGFLWALLDEGVVRTDLGNRIDVNRVNAPDGVLGPHREKEGSYYALKEIFSPVKMTTGTMGPPFGDELHLENRFHFTNLRQCSFRWVTVNFARPGDRSNGHTTRLEGIVKGPDIPPGEKGRFRLGVPEEELRRAEGLMVTVQSPEGEDILTKSWLLHPPNPVRTTGENAAESEESDTTLTLKANGIRVTFDKRTGMLAQLGNDLSPGLSFRNGPVMAGGAAAMTAFRHLPDDKNQVLEVDYEGALQSARWTLYPSGWLKLEYCYRLDGETAYAGISFDYPESRIISARWLGKGPSRVWKNRLKGGVHDVWENLWNNTHTGSAPWIYPEFKGYFADISWMEFNTAEGKFLVAADRPGLFVRLFDFHGLSGPVSYPALPPGDISFLDAIPPIGTKLALGIENRVGNLGPESGLNQLDGPISRTLYFYFGLPE